MKNNKLIVATNQFGKQITLEELDNWLINEDKEKLADFFFDRFHSRYIKPYNYKSQEYTKFYKNGFAIMTSCCLLIETFVSYTNSEFLNNNFKSERSFGYFFLTNKEFNCFSKGGLELQQYEKPENRKLNNKGIPKDFYRNVRCGIFHNGETKNNWKIVRSGVLFNEKNKSINASDFLKQLEIVLNRFRISLLKANYNNDPIWIDYVSRLRFMIDKSHSA